ncbi:MAG: S8 family serine peptidase, partial [Gammaproteobacteria bacterium]|nr:S8 family serine peptidase [Gammaproteobacteria bacterium]
MSNNPVARISALLIGILATVQVAQAADVFPRSERNIRPFSLTDPEARVRAVTDEVEVFVRFDLPSVAEYNARAIQAGGKMPAGAAQRSHAAKVSAQHGKMRNSLVSLGATELSALRVGANGMRVKISPRQLADLKQMPNVLSVAPVIQHYPDNAQSVPWIGTQAFWDTVGTGEGISVGIIDTGIDYTHANFGGPGTPADYDANDPDIIEDGTFPTAKVVGGFDFAGTNYNASDPANDTPVPDDDPLDENGHGSHVSGSAAGLGVPGMIGPGVAKGADLYGLKVFGADGSTNLTSDAIEWALDPNGDGDMSDHLDVINMSLGSAFGFPNDPSAVAADNAAALGIIVVASAGNSGDVPYVTGSPGVSARTISVAATTKGGEVPAIEVSGDVNGLIEATEGTSPVRIADGPVSGPLVQPDTATNVEGCGPIGVDMTDGIALISRGTCAFAVKSANAETAGAIGMVVYNDGTS